jgi:hypothetical protein
VIGDACRPLTRDYPVVARLADCDIVPVSVGQFWMRSAVVVCSEPLIHNAAIVDGEGYPDFLFCASC